MTDEQSGINEEHYSYGEVCRQRDAWRNRAETAEKELLEMEKEMERQRARAEDAIIRAEAAENDRDAVGEMLDAAMADYYDEKARADAAEKRLSALEEALQYVGFRVTYLTTDDGANIAVSLDHLEAK